MEDTRIRMVGDSSYAKETLISAFVRIIREDGVFKTFQGLPAMLSKQVPYTMAKQVSFDKIAEILYIIAAQANLKTSELKFAISTLAAFFTSILSRWVIKIKLPSLIVKVFISIPTFLPCFIQLHRMLPRILI